MSPLPRDRLRLLLTIALAAGVIVASWLLISPAARIRVITIDPRTVDIKPVVLDLKATRGLSFSQIVARIHPYAAISGTFYDDNLKPLGDVLIDGRVANQGRYPNAIAIRDDGRVEFVRLKGRAFDWRGYRCALAAGPRLVHRGEVGITPAADGFVRLDPGAEASRSGVGLTRSGRLLLVVCETPVNMWRFARIMRDLGTVEAMNLDGGLACALYRNGHTIVSPSLRITNLLVVYRRTSSSPQEP